MALQGWSEDDFIERLKVLKGEWTSKHTLDEVEQWRKIGAQWGDLRVLRDLRKNVVG